MRLEGVKQVAGGATAGSRRAYRLDPATLPVRGTRVTGAAGATFVIDMEHAVVRHEGSGREVPFDAYRGVAVRMDPIGSDGDVRGFVELLHADAEFTVTLTISDDPAVVSNDWQSWGRVLDMPLLIIGQDGSVGEPLRGMSGVQIAAANPRRRHSFFAKRRPRFLTRRKAGHLDDVRVVIGDEIFGTRH
jgi:hypothetical protein